MAPLKNIVAIVIKKGNLPLQGTKLLVRIAINLSLLELIILQPITPAALHPNPIHIVSACLPEEQHFLKHLSKLNAILGKYPKSSNKVNRGKNIASGGSITLIIHVTVLYIPSKSKESSQEGVLICTKIFFNHGSILANKLDKSSDG